MWRRCTAFRRTPEKFNQTVRSTESRIWSVSLLICPCVELCIPTAPTRKHFICCSTSGVIADFTTGTGPDLSSFFYRHKQGCDVKDASQNRTGVNRSLCSCAKGESTSVVNVAPRRLHHLSRLRSVDVSADDFLPEVSLCFVLFSISCNKLYIAI